MKSDQDLYKRLRDYSKEELWNVEVERFNTASPRERLGSVAVIRAVGMIFSRFGTTNEKASVRQWLTTLLRDPQEKIRRYAMAALPKIGASAEAENQMISLLKETAVARERKHLGRVLEKVGGTATLQLAEGILSPLTEQKVRAAISRQDNPGTIRLEALLPAETGMQIFLRCRGGLEGIVRQEIQEKLEKNIFKIGEVRPGCVTLTPRKSFSLAMLYELRCFATVGFSLALIDDGKGECWIEDLATAVSSPRARALMLAATLGPIRYRLDFAARGHQRGVIRQVVERAYTRAPEILNDARQSRWSVDVIPVGILGRKVSVELRPRLYPDPRLTYRQDDIAAASHPPLAAAMAWLAAKSAVGRQAQTIWDPFCGSALELIERSLLGGVAIVYGTDLDEKALEVARANFAAANLCGIDTEFLCMDFRDALGNVTRKGVIQPGSISLIISNPPLGRRIRVQDLRGLFGDFYAVASHALQPRGKLIFTNPLQMRPNDLSMKLEYSQTVDLGGFTCQLEMYCKL